MRNARGWTVLATASLSMLLSQWFCLSLVYSVGMLVASRAVNEARNYGDLSTVLPHRQKQLYCTDTAVKYPFTVHELRTVFRASQGTGGTAVANRVLRRGRKVFNCIIHLASTTSSSTAARAGGNPVSSFPTASTSQEFHAFTIKYVSLPEQDEFDQIQFYCKSREGGTATVLTCAPRTGTLPGSLILHLDFELLVPQAAKQRSPWCRIVHNAVPLSVSSFLEAAVGLCTAFGYSAQLLCNEDFAVVDLLPGLDHLGSAALGFKPQTARYIPFRQSFFLAGVKPTSDMPSHGGTDRGAAYFEPRHLEGFDSWFGVRISTSYLDHALQNIREAFQAAVMTDKRTTVGNDYIVRIAVPHGYERLFRSAGGASCTPNRPYLRCVRAVQKNMSVIGSTDSLSMLLKEIKSLIPDVRPSSARMLQLLSEPRVWRSLHALIGPRTARFFESPAQTTWYETMTDEDAELGGRSRHAFLHPSSESVASELFRYAIWYIDIFPSRRYWESLDLGCIRKDLAYVNAMGKVRTRYSPHIPALTEKGEENTLVPLSVLSTNTATHMYGPPDSFESGALLLEDEEARFTEKTAGIVPDGQVVKALQLQYSYEELQAVSDVNPPERESDAELRKRWLSSPLFKGQGYLLITDVPARDGGLFDLKILCSRTGRFRHTRLTGWFSNYLCEPDYVEVPNNDVSGVWRKDDMPVNRMIGIEFENRPPWRCGVSFLGHEHSLEETPVKGKYLITIMTGLCSLMGFKTGWVLDSVTDVYTKELMKITMVLEKRVSFYENHGFLWSVNTLKSRRRAETCVGTSVAEFGPPLVGACHQPYDILINPGFERTVLTTLARKAYDTLYRVTFDCNSSLWKNCAKLYPLSITDHRGNGCAFERHPLYQELKHLKPDKCSLGKRIGDCHRFVRKALKCDRYHERGCKYLAFLYSTFLYPGGDIEQQVPSVLRDHFEDVSVDLFQEGRRYMLDGINKATRKKLDDLATQRQELTAEGEPPTSEEVEGLNRSIEQPLSHEETDIQEMYNTLMESVIFHDWTNTPQFWLRALYRYTPYQKRTDDATEMYCPVGYAWAYITRIQGQLYRRPPRYAYRRM